MIAAPVAILGVGCRLPGGVEDAESFWQLLLDGREALQEVPASRWQARRFRDADPASPGKTRVARGGFLQQDPGSFDPLPFGISPREAESLDPQQRLLLETAWEALEDAGVDPRRLKGTATGVFMGGFCLDMKRLMMGVYNRELIDSHTAAGMTMTMLANRLSFCLDLRGPSLALDTACSSSLVAIHLACQSLAAGDCTLALVGGVNCMLVPEYFVAMSKGGFLSPEGRCATFSAQASGYARGEGAAVVLLKPLQAALADGDAIQAVIRASGVNQDGRTPGITLPNPEAQVALMEAVYRKAGLDPGQVAFVEAHGTGTRAGDAAELSALSRVFGVKRPASAPCLLGAVKANLGHLEAAAGVVGLIKALLVLRKGVVPPMPRQGEPTPDFDWAASGLRVVSRAEPLPVGAHPRLAAVNAFGYGGTNAHCVLQEWPAPPARTGPAPTPPFLLPLSAADASALRELAGRYAGVLRRGEVRLGDLVHTAALRRTHHPHRLAVVGDSAESLCRRLEEAASAAAQPGFAAGGLVLVYSGMGPQWWGMGRELAARYPLFRESFEAVDALFQARAGWSIRQAMGDAASSRIGETGVAQPANLALQVALTTLLRHWGVKAGAVLGHSVGEVAAAWAGGALSLEQAVEVVWQRSRWQQTLAGTGGGLLAVELNPAAADTLMRDYPEISVAALNAPRSLTLAGPRPVLRRLAAELERHEVFNRLLAVEIAYHSPAMEAIREPFLRSLTGLNARVADQPWFSTVTASRCDEPPGAAYWWANAREPVRFWEALQTASREGFDTFLEIGPHPVLQSGLKEHCRRVDGLALPTLHRQQDEVTALQTALAALYAAGVSLDWSRLVAEQAPEGRFARLPNYPWQRIPCWRESRRSREDRLGREGRLFLRERLPMPGPAWQVELSTGFFPWLRQHRVAGRAVFPAAAFVAAALEVWEEGHPGEKCLLRHLRFNDFLAVEGAPRRLVCSLDTTGRHLKLYSYAGDSDDSEWPLHAEAELEPAAGLSAVDLDAVRSRCRSSLDPARYYSRLASDGLDYGADFRLIRALSIGEGELLAEIVPTAAIGEFASEYAVHPCLLDAALHGLFALMVADGRTLVPVAIQAVHRVGTWRGGTEPLLARVRRTAGEEGEVYGDIELCEADGRPLVRLEGLHCRALPESPAPDGWY
ncbi:MAG: type I polyketide synthase, partial [Magnetococcales bacterium]|nr:type I polyketide synthase [Magnetococcales bacterium]